MKVQAPDEKVQKHLDLIKEQSDRANKIITSLLDFARTRPEESALVEIPALVQQALEQVQKPANVDVTTRLDANLPKSRARSLENATGLSKSHQQRLPSDARWWRV